MESLLGEWNDEEGIVSELAQRANRGLLGKNIPLFKRLTIYASRKDHKLPRSFKDVESRGYRNTRRRRAYTKSTFESI